MLRTVGAAIGALIIVFFMAHIAASLATPVSASSTSPSRTIQSQR
jgi:hypothetical protein